MIFIDNQQDFLESALLERAARFTLETSTALSPGLKPDSASTSTGLSANADITIILTDDAQLQELNRDYLGVDAPTDVLSFPASESDPETGETYLGDILISIPRATQQAQAAGHPVEAEVQLLVVHGVLHLLGHDHAEAEEKYRMWAEQEKVLERLGLGHIKIQDSE
ncbi:MAG: rRNA maturation RNase YbeY [Anaerolineales bacterium]